MSHTIHIKDHGTNDMRGEFFLRITILHEAQDDDDGADKGSQLELGDERVGSAPHRDLLTIEKRTTFGTLATAIAHGPLVIVFTMDVDNREVISLVLSLIVPHKKTRKKMCIGCSNTRRREQRISVEWERTKST
jgi:hypothetical protein